MIEVLLCLVVAVADGDSLRVRCGEPGSYEQISVRLAEIDAPERKQHFGERSKQSLSSLCYRRWAEVRPINKDRYGRTVARVRCRGEDASASQVQRGMAWAYTKYLTDPRIRILETEARSRRVGLWGDGAPTPPWEFRTRKHAEGAEGAQR